MIVDKQLGNELFDNGIYEAWQFVTNTARTLSTAEYCKDTILRLLFQCSKIMTHGKKSYGMT